jgi:hypothetical protein
MKEEQRRPLQLIPIEQNHLTPFKETPLLGITAANLKMLTTLMLSESKRPGKTTLYSAEARAFKGIPATSACVKSSIDTKSNTNLWSEPESEIWLKLFTMK